MSSSDRSASVDNPQRPKHSQFEIADQLEGMAKALKAISDPFVRHRIIDEMRNLLTEIEQGKDL